MKRKIIKAMSILLLLALFKSAHAYTINITNVTDKRIGVTLKFRNAIFGTWSEEYFEIDPLNLELSGAAQEFRKNIEIESMDFFKEIKATYGDSTNTVKPQQDDNSSAFLIELNRDLNSIIITEFKPSQTGPHSDFVKAFMNAVEKLDRKRRIEKGYLL